MTKEIDVLPPLPGAKGSPIGGTKLKEALQRIETILCDGLSHGFFHCEISSEIGKNKCRELIILSGKSHKFTIPLDEILP